MNKHKFLNIAISFLFIASFLLGPSSTGIAMPLGQTESSGDLIGPKLPDSPVDESKVPHYFGPYSNYANSAFTLADVSVDITGDGSGGYRNGQCRC